MSAEIAELRAELRAEVRREVRDQRMRAQIKALQVAMWSLIGLTWLVAIAAVVSQL
jgi:hypothetical protein